MTSKDKFKKQATYPKCDHTILKQAYWDHPIKKAEIINKLKTK